ncbi:MAG TPA: hypothetical protein VHE30_06920 [Polyangiaceae bacterium]|nr:hypothetical protein [Polyangiaceae bacterium]
MTIALLFATPWMVESGCVPKGACLRNTDCPKGQACEEGACAFESVVVVGDGSTAAARGSGGSTSSTDEPDASSSEAPASTDAGASVSRDAADVTPLTDR